MSELDAPERGISRRTIAKGAAWSVPVIAVGAAAPAMAISGPTPTGQALGACKLPGASCSNIFVKGYAFLVEVCNTSGLTIYGYPGIVVTDTNPDINLVFEAAVDSVTGAEIQPPFPILPGQCVTLILNAGENGSSSQQSISGEVIIPWGHTPDPANDQDHVGDPIVIPYSFPTTPPINGAQCTFDLPAGCGG